MILMIIIATAAGISNILARNINSILANEIGLLEGTFFNYVVGLTFSIIFLFLDGQFLKLSSVYFKSVPFWAYSGGMIGVIVVAVSSLLTPKISAFYLTLLMFAGQLFTGIVIDYFTLGLLPLGKIIGGLLVVSGLTYNLIIDVRNNKSILSQ